MIEFADTATRWFGPVSFKAAPGGMLKVVAPGKAAVEGFVRTAAGLAMPLSGRVSLFGVDIYSATEEEYLAVMEDVGVIQDSGGAVSNLRVWENVALPALYHGKMTLDQLEEETETMLKIAGISREEGERLMESYFAGLSPFHDRVFKMIRAAAVSPGVVIYEEISASLSGESLKRAVDLAVNIHQKAPDRVSVFVSSSEAALAPLPPAKTIHLAARE